MDGLLLPALATIATCATEDARHYPAEVVAHYVAAGLARQSVRRAVHGADAAASRLLAGIRHVVCNARVESLRQSDTQVTVQRQGADPENFDHVELATQATQAAALWQNPSPTEAQALAGFR